MINSVLMHGPDSSFSHSGIIIIITTQGPNRPCQWS